MAPAAGPDQADTWPRLHATPLPELRHADLPNLDDRAVDGSHVRAPKGGITSGPHPSTARVRARSTT
jgi:hypothetical protein